MNLNYRGIQCPSGRIASFFPGAQNWAVFQWTIKLPGMLTSTCVWISVALLKQLKAGTSTWEGYLPFPCVLPSPHRVIAVTSQTQSTSVISISNAVFLTSQHNPPPQGNIYADRSFFFFLLSKARWDLSGECISPTQTLSLACSDSCFLTRRLSGWWAVIQLFSLHLHRRIGLSQASPLVLGCDGRIGAAVDGSRQHHEAHDPAHNAGDDDGGHRVTQVGRPRLGLELTLRGVSLPRAVALRRPRNRLVGRAQLLPPGGPHIRRRERAGLVQLVRDLQELLSLPGVRWRTDDAVCYSPFKEQKQRMTTGPETTEFQNPQPAKT